MKLSYSTLSLEQVRKTFKLNLTLQKIFSDISPISPSDLLTTTLQRAADLSLVSEKARSEFIVAPILLEIRALLKNTISIYSGVRLDVSPTNIRVCEVPGEHYAEYALNPLRRYLLHNPVWLI